MALQTINIGNFVNDGTGDDLRTAFSKVNANFEELDLLGGQANTISNVGTGIGLYKEKIGVDLRLKTLVAGPGITLNSTANEVTVTNNRNMIVTVNADTGSLTASSATQEINIVGGPGISTSISGSTLTINSSNYNLETDTSPALGGDLNLNGFDIIGGAGVTITAENFVGNLTGNVTGNVVGNLTGLVYGLDIRNIANEFYFDFGAITGDVTSPVQFFLSAFAVDMGTITAPSSLGIDCGTIL